MNTTIHSAAKIGLRALVLACASLALVAPAANAQGHGGFHGGGGGHFGHGHFGPGFRGGFFGPGLVLGGIGLGIGLGSYYYGAPYYVDGSPYYVADPGYVVSDAPPVVYGNVQQVPVAPVSTPVPSVAPVPMSSSMPEPVIYPRKGQTTARTETDRQQCSQWAGTQNRAASDANVFGRALAACMDARGYTVR